MADDGGLEEQTAQGMGLAASHHLAAFFHGVGDVLLHLGDGVLVDQRPEGDAGVQAVAHLQLGQSGGELLDEAIMDAGLHV